MSYKVEDRGSTIYQMWEDGEIYKKKLGLLEQLPLNRDFLEDRHWGEIKRGTEKLPRPQLGMIGQIVETKVANILSSPIKAQYFSKDSSEAGQLLSSFNEYISKEIKEEELRRDIVSNGAVDGNGLLHYYFNSQKRNQRGEYEGGIDAEILDPLDIVVANPREQDIQKQDWIIYRKKITVAEAKKECQIKGNIPYIKADASTYDTNNNIHEKDNDGLLWVYTRLFKIKNEVFFEKSTKDVMIVNATPHNPELINVNIKDIKLRTNDAEEESDEDIISLSNPDELIKNAEDKNIRCFTKYPIANFVYKKRRGSFFGRSEVEPLINNNRAINYNTAMMCLSVEHQGWGTIVARADALGLNSITNDPSKILIDKYKGNANGFYTLNKQPFSQQALQLNQDIIDKTKSFSGANDVMTGEPEFKGQSGYAIAYLQQQAQKPIDIMIKTYHDFIRQCEEIKLQFYLLYYDNKKFTIDIKNNEFTKNLENVEVDEDSRYKELIFNSQDYINMDFNITVEVGAGTQYSELGGINMLDNLFTSGVLKPKSYIKMYPDNLLPNKNEILTILEEQEQSEIEMLKQQLQTTSQDLSYALALLKEQNEKVHQIQKTLAENESLKNKLANVSGEYSQTAQDATILAQGLYNEQNKQR